MAPVTWLTSADGALLSLKLDPPSGLGIPDMATIGTPRLKLAPPSCEIATNCSPWWNSAPSQKTYTVPSGPVRISESCLPPTALLLALDEIRIGLLHVLPPSVERATTIGSGEKAPLRPNLPTPWNSVQLAYTVPKNGLWGLVSTHT